MDKKRGLLIKISISFITLTLIMIPVLSVPKDDLFVFNWDLEKEGIIPFIATIVSVSIVIFSILTTEISDKLRFIFAKSIYFQSDKVGDGNEENTSFPKNDCCF